MRPIDADELADMLSRIRRKLDQKEYYTPREFRIRDFMLLNFEQMVRTSTTIDQVKHGRWHDVYMVSQQTLAQTCSCCQNTVIMNIAHCFNFCPACGAKMDANADATEATT